ncbi:MAG TPA: hydroxymethylglutaryl-CoA lyase [Beijerinckiaceae bacterium]|nr:hydroxymethylglutaryl-CoA lyase [Beijerinckiaceae bacterium]
MTDLPKAVHIQEEGPREGFQIEPGPVATVDKVRFIESLARTGLRSIQCVSFVDPKRVPGMADAETVVATLRRDANVHYTGLWLNLRGFERARKTKLDLAGKLQISASETFSIRNTGKDTSAALLEQGRMIDAYREHGMSVDTATIMAAFGCNFEGEISARRVQECVQMLMDLCSDRGTSLARVSLADTMGWANPASVVGLVGAIRNRWPELRLNLHLHDTRGVGLPNALAGLQMGVDEFDSSCAGLGGCPFAGHKSAAGNICTEDLVFMCEEMGIETGIKLDALIECAQMIEAILGHPLPGKIMHACSLSRWRREI